MALFLEGRKRKNIVSDMEEPKLNAAMLRTLIPGDFILLEIDPGRYKKLEKVSSCFLMLHEKGVFVILHTYRDGIIHGDILQEFWSSFNYLGDETRFPSPLQENNFNIEMLSRVLKLPKSDFHSCLVFKDLSELRRVPENSPVLSVIREDQLEEHFARLLPQLPARYTHNQLTALNDIFCLVTAETV